MNNRYLSTFLSGTKSLVMEAIKTSISNTIIDLSLDGLVTYSTDTSIKELKDLKFLNNTFVLIKQFDGLSGNYFKSMFHWAEKHGFKGFPEFKSFKTFRIIVSDANQLVTYDKRTITRVEKKVMEDLGLKVNRLNPDTEVWFLYRNEGYGFILLRLTNTSKVEHRNIGQLRPELANLMCLLASIKPSDTVLEPFAGHGTIVEQLRNMPHKKLIAFEKENNANEKLIQADFFANKLSAKSITKIITDPPWGLFDKNLNIDEFYTRMFNEFNRLLAKNGVIVVLLAREIELETHLKSYDFTIKDKFEILVSGRKATLYKIIRKL